jgi:hypothetical protein
MIYISNNFKGAGFSMFLQEIVINPHYQVVLESSLDNLMEEVRHEKFINISLREVMSKGLNM